MLNCQLPIANCRPEVLTLYLTRHAKSSKDDPRLRDFDRPLNERGLRDAPFMAQLFAGRKEVVDLLVSSPAKRAITTARHFALALGPAERDIVQNERIYLADAGLLMRVIAALPDHATRVMLFGHNPGFSDLAGHLTGGILDLPTCATVRIDLHATGWSEVGPGMGSLTWSDMPGRHAASP